ncbi:MAG: hypothetical protein MJ067_03085 [Oscillospiraceae bacterium]|nr:hypothetical protein [Oscillospiraceae bacterium]
MRCFPLILKRRLLSPAFIVLLLVCLTAIPFISSLGGDTGFPPAGFFAEGDDGVSLILSERFENLGYTPYEDYDELCEDVLSGRLDCGVFIPENISSLFERGKAPYGEIFASSSASRLSLRRAETLAVFFSEKAAYTCYASLEGAFELSEVREVYEERLRGEKAFSFDIETSSGGAPADTDRPYRLALLGGCSFLLLFSFFGLCSPAAADIKTMARRLSGRKLVSELVLPELLSVILLSLLVSSLSALLCGLPELILPFGLYSLALIIPAMALFLIRPSLAAVYCILCFFAAPAVCPVFTDIALSLPVVAKLRLFLASCWLWAMI